MKMIFPFLVALTCLSAFLTAKPIVISEDPVGMAEETLTAQKPNKAGLVISREVVLPEFTRGAYYRPFSGGVARGNRVEAVAFNSLEDLQAYKPSKTRAKHNNVQEGQFILLELKDGRYLSLLPMTSPKVYGQFFVEGGKLLLKTGGYGTKAIDGKIPLVIWAYGKSPYAATHAVWAKVFESGYVAAKPRSSKAFPEQPYGYLGWCSWEFYKRNISEKIMTQAAETLEATEAPIRWLMVDDGYFNEKGRKLISLETDQKKFPKGWGPIAALKNENNETGIKWVGVWRNMLGYMEGISPDHTMDDLKDHLVEGKVKTPRSLVKGKYLLPAETPEAAKALHDKMAKDAVDSGFDFTKVDFQTKAFDLYRGLGNAARASQHQNAALESACKEHGLPLLNCISQPNINSLQFSHSALARSSPDYNQADKDKNKCNTYQSFANHLWLGQTVWGDLDMFHTHDERDVKPMAIARAISGGPVYISDEPSKVVPEVLVPFALADGKLLRTAAPATLLPESFFIHPFRDEKVFRVIAPMEDGVAAIALFNFTEGGRTLTGHIESLSDYGCAGELLQPAETWYKLPEGLLVYDPIEKKAVHLNAGFQTEVENFGAKLFFLHPTEHGWAVIGRSDKYLPSAAVKIDSVAYDKITFTLKESGPLLIWSDNGAPKMDGVKFELVSAKLYEAKLPIKSGSKKMTLTR